MPAVNLDTPDMNTMHRSFSLLIASLCLLSLGCNDSAAEPPDDRVSTLVDQQVEELTEQVDIICDCWEERGFESRTSCHNGILVIGPAQVRCIKDAYAQDADIALDYLECMVPLEREYTECVDERLECSDSSSEHVCSDDYDLGRDSCIGLPPKITRDLFTCFE